MSVELAPRAGGGAVGVHRPVSRPGSPSPSASSPTAASASAGPLALRMIAFFAFAWVATAAYATLLVHPPQARVLALAATATAAGAALTLSAGARLPSPVLALLRAITLALALGLGLVIAGVPVRLLAPAHWDELATGVSHGVRGLGSWLWPYRGDAAWTRTVVLMPLGPLLLAAATLCFWPSAHRSGERRLLSLGVLVGLLVTGLANAPPGVWRVQGVLLTILLFIWFWLPTLAARDASRAGGWLLACLLAALLVAPVFEGGEGWFGTHAAPGAPQAISFRWDQVYGPIGTPRSNEPMLTLASRAPSLLRVTSLDRFDGTRFTRSAKLAPTRRLDLHPGPRAHGARSHTTMTVASLRSNLLVGGAGVTEQVRWPAQYATNSATAADGTLSLAFPLRSGASYVVDSYVPRPSTGALLDAPRRFPAVYRPYTQFELPATGAATTPLLINGADGGLDASSRSALEASPYARVFALAQGLSHGQHGPYEVAQRIDRFLRSNYTYTESPPRRRYPLAAFLLQDRRGYCQQFSGAMTLMLRMDGIPARVGVGFRPTLPPGLGGHTIVRAADAHAWVEAYFEGIGWISFDPTPAGAPIAAGAGSGLSRGAGPGSQQAAGAGAAKHHGTPAQGGAGGAGAPGGAPLALAALGGAALVLALACSLLAGARRVRHALEDDAAPAIDELGRALERARWPAAKAGTLSRIAAALRAEGRVDAAAYVELLRRARFGPAPAATTRAASDLEIAEGRAALRRALGRRGGLRTWLRAWYGLPPALSGGRLH